MTERRPSPFDAGPAATTDAAFTAVLETRRVRRVAARNTALGLVAGGLLVLAIVSGVYRCPLAAFFGVPCPGCGSTRSVLALFHGDLRGFLRGLPPGALVAGAMALLVLFGLRARRPQAPANADDRVLPREMDALERFALRLLVWGAAAQFALWFVRWFGLCGGPVLV